MLIAFGVLLILMGRPWDFRGMDTNNRITSAFFVTCGLAIILSEVL